MPVFRNFESDPVIPLLQEIRNGIDNLGASFASSLGGLGNLDFNFPTFAHTEIKSLDLIADTPTLIIERETIARRNTVKNAETSAGVLRLIQGQEEPAPEEFLKSPWVLKSGEFRVDDRDGGYPLWAMALGGAAKVEVAIEYAENPNQEIIPMQIKPLFGTGLNWKASEWYFQDGISMQSDFDSSMTGWKLFSFQSFTSNKTYNLEINPGTLVYDSARANPINIYLFDTEGILNGNLFALLNAYWMPFGIVEIRKILSIAKKSSWVAKLNSTGGIFSITPNHGRYIGLIDVALEGKGFADTAIFTYESGAEQDTGIFTLQGV